VIHQNILRYAGARYLWWSLVIGAAGIALYVSQNPAEPRSGGTWQGYVLGTVGALLVVWLTVLGIRKRRYRSRLGTVQGWTSAHVYLGAVLLLVATLHCAGQFGWNIHTLAYVLMCVVIGSGFVGLYTYLVNPRLLSDVRAGGSREALFAELFELDNKSRDYARQSDADVQTAVLSGIARTALGGGVTAQLLGRDASKYVRSGTGTSIAIPNTDQQPIIDFVAARVPRANKRAEAANLQALLSVLSRRQAILRRLRRDVRLQGWLTVWLYVHVPVTVGLLAALIAHIVSTFVYW
jgi:hypothetical protein